MDILLVTWDGAGNLPPQRSLLRALLRRGHTARVLGPASIEAGLRADGAEFVPYLHVPERASAAPSSDGVSIKAVTDSPGVVADLTAAIGAHRPHLLLCDWFLSGAFSLGKSLDLPMIALGQTLYRSVSRSPLPGVLAAADLVLMFSHRSLDSRPPDDRRYVYIGGARPFEFMAGGPEWESEGVRVLVSLSTSYQGQQKLLQRLCNALSTLAVEAIVSTGPAVSPGQLRAGANTKVTTVASHDDLLKSASLLITHGGHGTVLAGAAYGVPMLILPMGRDQLAVADDARHLGIASVVDPAVTVARLRDHIRRSLSDSHTRNAARGFATSVPAEEGLETAIQLIENIGTHQGRTSALMPLGVPREGGARKC